METANTTIWQMFVDYFGGADWSSLLNSFLVELVEILLDELW
jgi:hypothetical protein